MTARKAGTTGALGGKPAAAGRSGAGRPPGGRGRAASSDDFGVATPPEEWPTGRLLSTAAWRVERAWDAYLEQWSLTHASLPALAILAGAPRSQRELAAALKINEQSAIRMLLRLERIGYVQRRSSTADRRRHVVA